MPRFRNVTLLVPFLRSGDTSILSSRLSGDPGGCIVQMFHDEWQWLAKSTDAHEDNGEL